MRLIDADALCKGRVSNDPVVIAAKCEPTIEAEPVRHGNWVNSFVGMYACSKCGVNDRFGLSRYCPNSGARMDGGMEND